MSIVANLLWALGIIRPGIHWAPIMRLSTRWADNRNWHVGKRVELHHPGRKPGRDHPASIWAPSDNIGHRETSGPRPSSWRTATGHPSQASLSVRQYSRANKNQIKSGSREQQQNRVDLNQLSRRAWNPRTQCEAYPGGPDKCYSGLSSSEITSVAAGEQLRVGLIRSTRAAVKTARSPSPL